MIEGVCYLIVTVSNPFHEIGYRLVYEVNDKIVTVVVVAVGKRDKSEVYEKAAQRLIKDIVKK